MIKKRKVFGSKGIVCLVFILLLLLSWQPISFSQEISRPVTYSAEFKPLGDSIIDWEASVPPDFESVHLYFQFQVDPGSVETEINGNITFDQDNQTLSAEARTVTVDGNSFVGKLAYSGGIILSGEIVFDFVIPIPLFPDISIDHSVPIPGFPQIDESWNEEKLFNSLLLEDGEAVKVEGGVRKLVSVEITAVEIAELLAVVLSQGTLPLQIADKAGKIIKDYIGDGGISLNGGLKNRFTLSGIGIYIDGHLITEENQTVSIPTLNPSLNSYSLQSSYEEQFSVGLDFVLSSDVFFNFAPFGIEVWSYEKEILEVPIPIVPDTEINTLDFVTTPDTITFATKTNEQPTVNRSPVAASTITLQTVRIGDAYTKIDISDKFSDPDGDTLTYLATSSNQNVLTLQRVGSELTLLPWTAGNATVTVTATDPNGLAATQTFSVTVEPSTPTAVNRAPEPVGTINTQSLYVGGYSSTIDVSSYFHDLDGDTLTYSATSNNTSIVTAESLNNARIRINPQANGSTTVTVTASDGNLSTTQSFSVTVSTRLIIGNRAPVAQGTMSSQTMTVGDASTTIDVSGYFRDPDGDSLTYSVSSADTEVVSVQRTGTSSIRLTPEGNGSATVTVTASDSSLSVTHTFSVTVNSSSVNISDVSDVVVENISADYTNNYPGERYTVSVTVRNAGGRRAPNVRVRYYYSADATYSTDDEEYENLDDGLGSMDSGETSRESVNLDAPDEQGSYYIIARADRVTNERNTRNNYAAVKITVLPPPMPDLVVTLTASHRNIYTLTTGNYLIDSNDYFKLIADVRNQGKADAPDRATVRYYFSTDLIISSDDVEFDTDRTWQLDAGDSDDDSTGLRAPEKPGDYYYYASVDSVEGEGNIDNNYSDVIKVSVRGPDLVIESVSVDYPSTRPTTVLPNGKIELSIIVRNQGTDDSRSTRVRYYVSSNSTLSKDDDTEVTNKYLGGFDINESRKQTPVSIYTPYTSGVFYCFVCIDEVEDEIHTDNNCSDPIKITVRNVAPQPQGTIPAQTLNVGIPLSLDVSEYFVDANNDTLTYTANSSDNNVATATATQSQVTITPKGAGTATITVTASDGALTATQTISVSVDAVVSEETWMPDANLRAAVRASLKLKANDPLTHKKMTELTSLNADSKQIINLTGLEYATNLTSLIVPRNKIKVLTPLRNLITLTHIDLHYNQISDLTHLKNLVALTVLRIGANKMTNITPLKNLTELTELWLPYNNQISDFKPLKDLTNLTILILYQTQISDLTPLKNLTELTELWLYDNQISDITALKHLTALTSLQIQNNQISDISSIEDLTALSTLYLSGNPITDYTPLRKLKTKNPNLSTDVSIPAELTPNRVPVSVRTISGQFLRVRGSAAVVDVSGNFSDPDNDPLTYSANSSNTNVATASVSGSQITITPVGAGSASITVEASDGEFTATQTFSVTVSAAPVANQAPGTVGTISDRTFTVGDSSIQIDVSSNFWDPDNNTLTYAAYSDNSSIADASVSGSQVTITPVGAGSASITVEASDGEFTATHTFSVTVSAAPVANHAPVTVSAISARTLTVGGSAVVIDVANNFNDPDGDSLTYSTSSDNSGVVTASVSGSQVTITPVGTGSATITVTASDGELTATQTISVTVTAAPVANRAPITVGAISARTLTVGGSAVVIDVANNFNDPDGDSLTYSTSSDNSGVVTASVSGSQVTITPVGTGSATITVTASDGELTATQTISVTATAAPVANRAPITVGGGTLSWTMTLGISHSPLDISGVFSDPDNDALTYSATSNNNRVATVNMSGSLVTITPVGTGSATITVTASDGELTATQIISVTVHAAVVTNRAPVTVGTISAQTLTAGGTAATVNVSGNFNDPDNDTLTYTATSSTTSVATASVSGSQITITPVGKGSATITVTASDGKLTATQTISVNVNAANVSEEAWMPDANLRAAVRAELGLQEGEDLTQEALQRLTFFSAGGPTPHEKISNMSGLEHATNLQSLYLTDNSISDISAVSGLTSLTWLELQNNSISDISAVSGLTSLTVLELHGNSISDISAVSGLTSLTSLGLGENSSISDISAVSGLTSLTSLGLGFNSISDISAVSGLTSLSYIELHANSISDISAVSGLTSLTGLLLVGNSISDISAVSGLTSLTRLSLGDNSISDISAVSGLTSLTRLGLAGNSISDISAVSGLTSLTYLYLSNNSISDVSPLESLTAIRTLYVKGNPITDYAPLRRLQAKTTQNIFFDVDISAAPMAPVAKTALLPNYPNPFNPETWIPYQLAKSANVTLTIYNMRGVVVRQLVLGHRAVGVYYSRSRAAHWDGRNNLGEKVAAGIYFVKFRAGNYTKIRKMLIRK